MRASRPSTTAAFVAGCLLVAENDKRFKNLIPQETLRLTKKLSKTDRHLALPLWLLSHRSLAKYALIPANRYLLKGWYLHFVLRKRIIEKAVRDAIASGCKQVLVVGAGYDTLCWRLAEEFPHVQFFESDHPATQKQKRHVMLKGESSQPNLHFVEVDLEQKPFLATMLESAAFKQDTPTISVCEGLFMYLEIKNVRKLLADLRFNQQSRVVFTYLDSDIESRVVQILTKGWGLRLLSMVGEGLKSVLSGNDLEDFINKLGYQSVEVYDGKSFAKELSHPTPLVEGENIAVVH